MNPKLWEAVNDAYNAEYKRVRVKLDGSSSHAHLAGLEAAIAAHNAFIREAAAREDVVEATSEAFLASQKRDWPTIVKAMSVAMLDQIERTPDEDN